MDNECKCFEHCMCHLIAGEKCCPVVKGMHPLQISHSRFFELQDGIERENLLWAVTNSHTGDMMLFFENPGDDILFLLRYSK